jgi:hypothetical protein
MTEYVILPADTPVDTAILYRYTGNNCNIGTASTALLTP